ALALSLRNGPEDVADMMLKAPRPLPHAQTAALDAVAAQGGPFAGIAAYDAALLHQLAPPDGAGAPYWNDVAARFHAAAGILAAPAQRAGAEDRAKAAEAVAHAVAEAPASVPAKPAGK